MRTQALNTCTCSYQWRRRGLRFKLIRHQIESDTFSNYLSHEVVVSDGFKQAY